MVCVACVCMCVRKDWLWLPRRTRGRRGGCQGSWGTEMTNIETGLCSARCHRGQPEGGLRAEASWGHPGTRSLRHIKSASPCMEPFVQQNPAWPASAPSFSYCRHLPLHSAHQQTPNEPASRKQTPTQPARSPPPPGSREGRGRRRHFTRTDDAAKTTIMIINLLNLEDYAVN